MKSIFIILAIVGLSACGTSKELSTENKSTETIASDGKLNGIVYVSIKGCSVLIETVIEGETLRLYPVNLDEKFKSDGIRIMFNYSPSRAMQPEGCTLIDRVVSVENVEYSPKK